MSEVRLASALALPELTDLISKTFVMYQEFEPKNAEQLFMRSSIPAGTGDSRRFDEFDTETYARGMKEGEDAHKGAVGVGLTLAQVKSSLINGENLKDSIMNFMATLSKQANKIAGQLQRLSERNAVIA